MVEHIKQIEEPVIAINLNQTYRSGISTGELYDCTRGIWRVDCDRATSAQYAFAIYQGQVKEVYEINQWQKELSTEYKYRRPTPSKLKNRYEFVGKVAPENIREKYVGKHMPEKHGQNPIRYYNC